MWKTVINDKEVIGFYEELVKLIGDKIGYKIEKNIRS
jgi:hypothetical protein